MAPSLQGPEAADFASLILRCGELIRRTAPRKDSPTTLERLPTREPKRETSLNRSDGLIQMRSLLTTFVATFIGFSTTLGEKASFTNALGWRY